MKTTLDINDNLLADALSNKAMLAAATLYAGQHLVSFDRDLRKLLGRSQLPLLNPTSE
jgi:hypothetical protein